MLDALAEKYRDREKPSAMGALLFENPEYKGSLKTLQNKAQELFGMSLVKYFRSIGIMAEKGSLRSRAASSTGREETAVGLFPAATARLKDLYQGLNPRFYGTFEDAVRKLEGLEAGCTRGAHARFCITEVTDCRPDVEVPQGFHFIQEGPSKIRRPWTPAASSGPMSWRTGGTTIPGLSRTLPWTSVPGWRASGFPGGCAPSGRRRSRERP